MQVVSLTNNNDSISRNHGFSKFDIRDTAQSKDPIIIKDFYLKKGTELSGNLNHENTWKDGKLGIPIFTILSSLFSEPFLNKSRIQDKKSIMTYQFHW